MDMNDVNDLVFDASPDFDLAVSLEARVIVYLICLKSDCAAFSVYDRGYFVSVVLHIVCLQELLHFSVPDSVWLDVVEKYFFVRADPFKRVLNLH